MPTLRNNFTSGKMNLDIDERLLRKGEYRTASNIRVVNSNGSDVGAIEKSLSNGLVSTLNLGSSCFTLGGIADENQGKIYLLIKSENGSFIIEHDIDTDNTVYVCQDTRVENVLNFNENYLVTGIVLVEDIDNGNRFLIFTDNLNEPRCINIDRAKLYGENGFEEEDILLIKKPPINCPTISLSDTGSEENNIKEKFLRFATRFKYLDNEYSAISPLSDFAFEVNDFEYDYSTSTNKGMTNKFNQVDITFNSGSKRVKEVELICIEPGTNIPYLVESYKKSKKSWTDDTNYTVSFTNNKIYKTLSERQFFRLFDAVPKKAKALELINNQIVFGNYTENWDLIDDTDSEVNIDLGLSFVSEDPTLGEGYKTNKSNRDYEIGIVYGEKYGRHTTVLSSENNTIHVPIAQSSKKTTLKASVNNKPPKFANWFRFYIKQNKYDYNVIPTSLFYKDGSFTWVRLEKYDADKINEGDFLIVKSDTQRILPTEVRVKVLEVKDQPINFLTTEETTNINQLSGTYFKIKAEEFLLDEADLELHESILIDGSGDTFAFNHLNVIQPPIFYGDQNGLDDLTASGNATNTTEDIRYEIEIDSLGDGTTTFDTFRWRKNGGAWEAELQAITIGSPINLDNGVQVNFINNIGHNDSERWVVSAKASPLNSNNQYAFGYYPSIQGEIIKANSVITIIYHEFNNEDYYKVFSFISSKEYANLEEWFYEENIDNQFATDGIPSNRIFFRRGAMNSNIPRLEISPDGTGQTVMMIRSQGVQNGFFEKAAKIKATIQIRQSDQSVIFETDPKSESSDIYFEIGTTYPIVNGLHTSTETLDVNQTNSTPGEFLLPTYNCFGWGNGIESIKIKDLLNENSVSIRTRPNTTIENYKENSKIASLTWGQAYNQSLNYNGLNEFNLSQLNFKDLDDKYGEILAIKSHNTDLDVWQKEKVHKVLYGKTLIYNEDGSSNIAKSNLLFDSVIAYAGEYGMSNPESLVSYGNYRYWIDAKRGYLLRKGQSGIEVISNNGMRDWFRDYFRSNQGAENLACYDPYYDQLTLSLNGITLTFDEKVKGFTSFHSFAPDFMIRLGNDFYSTKNGELYKHNIEGSYNNFYGVQYKSEVVTIFNDESSLDKIFKTLIQEASTPWKVDLKTNYTEGHIKTSEFNQRESRWFAYMRKNESATDLNEVAQGLGNIDNIVGLSITVASIPDNVNIGDSLCQIEGGNEELIGEIVNIQGNVIVVDAFVNAPNFDNFAFTKKDPRIEGGEIRGYYLEVSLQDESNSNNELFAISSEVSKSF